MALNFDASYASRRHDVPQTASSTPLSPSTDEEGGDFWGEDGFTFGDILDILNPLQHIPVVSTIYRAITGDEVSTGARVFGSTLLGGALFGSIAGLFGTVIDSFIKETTGKEIGEHALAMFDREIPGPQEPPIAVAAVTPPPADGPGDGAAKVAPVWLARMPTAQEDYGEIVAKLSEITTADVILEAMSQGLDKYDRTKIALERYQSHENKPAPRQFEIDTVL